MGDVEFADIGRIEVPVGRRIEFALLGDQDVDGTLQFGGRAERVFEPDVEIMRRRRELPNPRGMRENPFQEGRDLPIHLHEKHAST